MKKNNDQPKKIIKHNNGDVLAFADLDFLELKELRHIRMLLEFLRPELILDNREITNAIAFFGSARIPDEKDASLALSAAEKELAANRPDTDLQKKLKLAKNVYKNSQYLKEATKLAEIVSTAKEEYVVFTGGGPSFMSASNKGAHNKGEPSVALSIKLPMKESTNPYITPELTFQFKYFSMRKVHFLQRAKALVAFPGGFGTFDELFEALTLVQTEIIQPLPFILFNKNFWNSTVNFEALAEQGTISASDLDCIHFVETAEEAWAIIQDFYK